MKFLLALVAMAFVVVVCGDIVAQNGICVEEIKALELCLNEAGQGNGWCHIGKTVNFPPFGSDIADPL